MRKSILLIIASVAACTFTTPAQIEQAQRARERMERAARGAEERNRRGEPENSSELPKPRASVMNVNVQTVLTKAEYKTFADAKPNAVTRISDGDPLWLYVKFNGKLGDYVLTVADPESAGERRYLLYAELGPQNDVTTLDQYVIEFRKEDLAAQELKINLAPGMQGRNKSIPVILMTSAAGRPGVWHNEFRLTNNIAFPRALTDNLAKTPITLDLTGGPSKYRMVAAAYDSLTIRGTADAARMPTPGTFFDESLKSEIAVKLHSENIEPARFYFAGDNWSEYATFSPQTQRSRKVYAVFTYKNSESCFYGTAQAVQSFDAMAAKFVTATISLQKDIPIPCTQI